MDVIEQELDQNAVIRNFRATVKAQTRLQVLQNLQQLRELSEISVVSISEITVQVYCVREKLSYREILGNCQM